MASKQEMLDMAARLRATVSESERQMLDEAARMLEEAASLTHDSGYWICENNPNYSPFDGSPSHIYICSACGLHEDRPYPYCHCGTKMIGCKEERV